MYLVFCQDFIIVIGLLALVMVLAVTQGFRISIRIGSDIAGTVFIEISFCTFTVISICVSQGVKILCIFANCIINFVDYAAVIL